MKSLMQRILPFLLLAACLLLLRPAAASSALMPVADSYVQTNAAAQNFNSESLFISYDGLGSVSSSATSFMRFDMSAADPISSASLYLTEGLDQLNATGATVTLYAVADDGWDEGAISAENAPTLGSVLQTLSLPADLTFDAPAVASYLEAERNGDGAASLAVQIDSVSGGNIWGAIQFGDREQTGGLTAPAIYFNGAVPTAISLLGGALDVPSQMLLVVLLALLTTGTALILRRRGLRLNARIAQSALVVLIFGSSCMAALFRTHTSYAAVCSGTPALYIQQTGNSLLLEWTDNPLYEAVDVYTSNTDPFFETGTLLAGEITDSQLEVARPANGSAAYYKIVPQCEADGQPASSNTVGAQSYALTPGGTSFIGMPFLPQGLDSAETLAAHIGGVQSMRQWNIDTQGFRYFFPPQFGHNFDINAGDALFVTLDSSAPTSFTAVGDVIRLDFPLVPDGYSLFAVPLQTNPTSADELASQIGPTTDIFGWNGNLDASNFALGAGSPVIVQGTAGTPPRWPGFQSGNMTWAQTYGGFLGRNVLLQWQFSDGVWPPDPATVLRREMGSGEDWDAIGAVTFAQDEDALLQALGDVFDILAVDLRDAPAQPPLDPTEMLAKLSSDPSLAALLARQYHQVSLATGSGFIDEEADTADWEYYVEVTQSRGKSGVLEPICAPYSSSPTYTLTGFRDSEVANLAYEDHGLRDGSHPDDAANRYQWGAFQQARLMDGRTALIWDDPASDFSEPARGSSCVMMPESAGATYLLRKRPARIPSEPLVLLNELTEGGGVLGVQPSAALATADPSGEAYYFSDYVVANTTKPDPDDIYVEWLYEACAVNALGETLDCAEHETTVREFDAPASVITQSVTLPTDHSEIQLTFSFSDSAEISFPLIAHVMRADEATTPLDQWDDIETITIESGDFDLYDISDAPPVGTTQWYRVQIRDNAGNWSPPSPPIFGTRYDRSKVPFIDILSLSELEDNSLCETLSLPYTSPALGERVKQIAVYRSFNNGGDYVLIKRIWPDEGPPKTFTFEDDYQPPFGTIARYRFEAIDGHSNISDPAYFCAALEGSEPIPPADVEVSVTGGTVSVDVQDTAYQPIIELSCPGSEGNQVSTVAPPGTPWAASLAEGETCQLTVQNRDPFGNATGPANSYTVANTVNFRNTNRQLTELGNIVEVIEDANGQGDRKIVLAPNPSNGPYGALFRRPVGGNWHQITNIQSLAPDPEDPQDARWQIWDTTDRTDGIAYEYSVLAFSTQSYELLGFWTPFTVPAEGSASTFQLNDLTMDPPTTVDSPCIDSMPTPGDIGLPAELALANGWSLLVSNYYVGNNGGSCPTMADDTDHLYGLGQLIAAGGDMWLIEFVDIALNGNEHINGRISADLNVASGANNQLAASITQIELFPNAVNTVVELSLPNGLRLLKSGTQDSVVGKFENVTSPESGAWSFDPLVIGAMDIVDESLQWQMKASQLEINANQIRLAGLSNVTSRVGEIPDNVYCQQFQICASYYDSGSNAKLLGQTYVGSDVSIRRNGLSGSFTTGDDFSYRSSFPADMLIRAESGATLSIADSRIASGALNGASASFDRITNGTVTDFMFYDAAIVTDTERIQYRKGFIGASTAPQFETLDLSFPGDLFALGADGVLLDSAELQTDPNWPNFSLTTRSGNLFIAPIHSFGAGASGAPAPAVAAWEEIGLSDPGFNINFSNQPNAIGYGCFTGGDFGGSADIYLRRGGVSENIILSGEAAARSNSRGYAEKLGSFDGLFLDNGILQGETAMSSELSLPFPSDVLLPLSATAFNSANCPVSFELDGADSSLHSYWGLELALTSVSYQPTVGTTLQGLDGALGATKELLVLNGSAEINGLNYDTTDSSKLNDSITLKLAAGWLPTGDIGNFSVLQHGNEVAFDKMYRVNGANFALSDLKINRYYSDPLDTSSLPSTLGLDSVEANMTEFPLITEMIFNGYDMQSSNFQQALADCVWYLTGPCGLILIDGDAYVEYFGRIESEEPTSRRRTPFDPLDNPVGNYPLASTNRTTITVKHVVQKPSLHWMWPILNDQLDELLPVGVMLNSNGGALAYVSPDTEILPITGAKFLEGDLGAVVQLTWGEGEGYDDKIGVFFGATASQAAFRALAMNRPKENGDPGVLDFFPFTSDLGLDITDYAHKFGYTSDGPTGDLDVVDLAATLWTGSGWYNGVDQLDFSHSFDVVLPEIRKESWTDTYDGYGISDLAVGETLSDISGFNTAKGIGQATFWLPGSEHGLEIDFIGLGTQVSFDSVPDPSKPDEKDKLFHADWVQVVYNRDKEIIISGEGMQSSLTGEYEVVVDAMLLIGTKPGNRRIEGGLRLHEFKAEAITFKNLGATFGLGQYTNETIAYIGIMGEGSWDQYRLGGILLMGKLYDSDVIRFAGFGDALDRLQSESPNGDPGVFLGFYMGVYGDIPVYSDALIEANASGDLRLWYFLSDVDFDQDGEDDAVYGGELNASVYATVAKIVSGRGNLGLAAESIFPGGTSRVPATAGDFSQVARNCPSDVTANPDNTNCFALTGVFWIAAGIGGCEPETWTSWTSRWWDDSWCANAGAIVGLGYIDQPPTGEGPWDFDYELDSEFP